ncbi:MAG: 50S ribosomal protein L20 [Nitrospirota bacterium]|jgi:large subunit ribosomal protein L20
MPRARGGFKTRRRRKKVLSRAKGFYSAKSRNFRSATEAVDKALRHAYADRRAKKREFRSLWIARINAAARQEGLTYSQLMKGLRDSEILLNRKVLADMAYRDPEAFRALVGTAREKLAS